MTGVARQRTIGLRMVPAASAIQSDHHHHDAAHDQPIIEDRSWRSYNGCRRVTFAPFTLSGRVYQHEARRLAQSIDRHGIAQNSCGFLDEKGMGSRAIRRERRAIDLGWDSKVVRRRVCVAVSFHRRCFGQSRFWSSSLRRNGYGAGAVHTGEDGEIRIIRITDCNVKYVRVSVPIRPLDRDGLIHGQGLVCDGTRDCDRALCAAVRVCR